MSVVPADPKLAALDRLGVWAALALLIVVASALSPYFFSLNNFLNILNQASVVGVAAVGMTLVMITGGVDLERRERHQPVSGHLRDGHEWERRTDRPCCRAQHRRRGRRRLRQRRTGRQAQPAELYPDASRRRGRPGPRSPLHWRDGERRRRSVVAEHDRQPTRGRIFQGWCPFSLRWPPFGC